MKIELFYSPGCKKCMESTDALRAAAETSTPNLDWCELNVLDELDYAIELGVLTLPAMAINGALVFARLPTTTELTQALRQRLAMGS